MPRGRFLVLTNDTAWPTGVVHSPPFAFGVSMVHPPVLIQTRRSISHRRGPHERPPRTPIVVRLCLQQLHCRILVAAVCAPDLLHIGYALGLYLWEVDVSTPLADVALRWHHLFDGCILDDVQTSLCLAPRRSTTSTRVCLAVPSHASFVS